ncbi:hypothetical protein D3C85_1931300 [compost metagenome]
MLLFEAARRKCRRTKADATWTEWWQRIVSHAIGIKRQTYLIKCLFGDFTINTKALIHIG